ncbi:MAG: hypothetical protein NVS3B5_03850 [Sphingomicrobium sp.]
MPFVSDASVIAIIVHAFDDDAVTLYAGYGFRDSGQQSHPLSSQSNPIAESLKGSIGVGKRRAAQIR